MENTNQPTQRDQHRMQSGREELVEIITRAVPKPGEVEPFPGLHLIRISEPTQKVFNKVNPSLCLIAQGAKDIYVGNVRYHFDTSTYLIATMELPWFSQILNASKEKPYLGLIMDLDPALVSSVMFEIGDPSSPEKKNVRAIDVSELDVELLDALLRLLRLIDSPEEGVALMPMVFKEIIYRLLAGSQGARLRYLAVKKGYSPHITRAVERVRKEFDQPLDIEGLAQDIGMSVSSLYHQFKAVTAMSPLQFQKQIRLQEARNLMLCEGLDAANAGYRVGYRDASHFNREYKNFFGAPPLRDVQQLRIEMSKFSG